MWRFRGRYLHSVAGVGMSSEGFDVSSYFSRRPARCGCRIRSGASR
jgi:N,N-dimethylformamidase